MSVEGIGVYFALGEGGDRESSVQEIVISSS
jgi:hypothetical protein